LPNVKRLLFWHFTFLKKRKNFYFETYNMP